jgi:hypothetical protein
MAESTFNLRSLEYAFMDLFSCRFTTYATRCQKTTPKYSRGASATPARSDGTDADLTERLPVHWTKNDSARFLGLIYLGLHECLNTGSNDRHCREHSRDLDFYLHMSLRTRVGGWSHPRLRLLAGLARYTMS